MFQGHTDNTDNTEGGLFIPSLCLVIHVLCMASIYYCDGVAIYRVGEVPLVGIGSAYTSRIVW